MCVCVCVCVKKGTEGKEEGEGERRKGHFYLIYYKCFSSSLEDLGILSYGKSLLFLNIIKFVVSFSRMFSVITIMCISVSGKWIIAFSTPHLLWVFGFHSPQ